MKAIRLWQGSASVVSGRVQIAESESNKFFIRTTESRSAGGAYRFRPRYGAWHSIEMKKSSFTDGNRKISTNITRLGKVNLSQIVGACRLRLPNN